MFNSLYAGQLELFCLHFGKIILLPKVNEAERIQQYRPIFLLNVSFKIFTKVAMIRLNTVADHVVRSSQTAFMQGRNILDGVVMLHETVHELNSKKLNGVILKQDFKKAYDKVKLSLLQQTLRMKGFSEELEVVWPSKSMMRLAGISRLEKAPGKAIHYPHTI
jgi:hypothetical protein